MVVDFGESNQLQFFLKINGTTSNPEATKPTARFLLTDPEDPSVSFSLPLVSKSEDQDNVMSVEFPDNTSMFKEHKTYTGKVEVIVGNKYISPVSVSVVFERPVVVEVTPLTSPSPTSTPKVLLKEQPEEENDDPFSSFLKPLPSVTEDLNNTFGNLKDALFSEHQVPLPPIPSLPKKKDLHPPVANTSKPVHTKKTNLKNLLVAAWKELE